MDTSEISEPELHSDPQAECTSPEAEAAFRTDDLVADCLRAARNLGFTQGYRSGRDTMDLVRNHIEALSAKLSTTQRSILGTAVLYYLWNSVRTHYQYQPGRLPQIIDINDSKQLSDVIMTCFIWILSFQEGQALGPRLDHIYSLVEEDVSTWEWDTEPVLNDPATPEPDTASTEMYFDIIRTTAINWAKEITKDFNETIKGLEYKKGCEIVELSTETRPRNANDIGSGQATDVTTDPQIKSLLAQLSRHEFSQCREIMNSLSTRLSQIWLNVLAIVVLSLLRGREAANDVQADQLREICHTCMDWIQPMDKDLIAVEELTSKITGIPGSIMVWREPTFGVFSKIWHRIHTTDGMKNPWELGIELKQDTVLCHTTIVGAFIQMLRDATGDTIKIQGRQSCVNYTGVKLVWTGVQLTNEEVETIPDSYGGKGTLIDSPGRYGSVCLQFPLGSVFNAGLHRAHILSTRRYKYEYSQSIFVTPFEKVYFRQNEKSESDKLGVKLAILDSPISLLEYKWKLGFSNQQHKEITDQHCSPAKQGRHEAQYEFWTHPEVVFHDGLAIPLDKLKITFIRHSGCVGGKRCEECGLGLSAADVQRKFDRLWRAEGLHRTYDIEQLNDELSIKIIKASPQRKWGPSPQKKMCFS